MKTSPSRLPRMIIFVLLSLTAAMTLLGGIGTTCVAFNAENFGPRMAPLIPVKPIFQALVFVSIAAGAYGVYSIVLLARSKPGAYRAVLIFLLAGLVSSGVQFYYSLTLRGSTAPNNIRLYLTALALLVMLLLRLTGLWQKAGMGGRTPGSGNLRSAGGAALFTAGLVTITTPVWAAPTHMVNGINTSNVLFWPLLLSGAALILCGGLYGRLSARKFAKRVQSHLLERK